MMVRMTGRASPFHGRLASCRLDVVAANVDLWKWTCIVQVYVFPPPADASANRPCTASSHVYL